MFDNITSLENDFDEKIQQFEILKKKIYKNIDKKKFTFAY